ncbi:MAG: hypothetical protein ACRDD8_15495 [Bacteroidales bacterium]
MATTPLINGKAYDWSDIEIRFSNITGEPIMDIKAISWKADRKIESNYGIGSQPISRGYGNWTYEASIDLGYGAQVELQRLSPDGTLHGLGEFDVIIAHQNIDEGKETANILQRCIFSEDALDAKQDDTDLVQTFKLNPGGIIAVDNSTFV